MTSGLSASFNPSRGIAIIQTCRLGRMRSRPWRFNPSRGIAIIQTFLAASSLRLRRRFNPSRGIAIIQTQIAKMPIAIEFSFNPSRGIAIIQTLTVIAGKPGAGKFQSLTRDSNHSNKWTWTISLYCACFNPSRGIAIIQTSTSGSAPRRCRVSIPHAG